ncbi:hypothetical protein LUU34_00636600 [Aix galericulata]|nr:hypothetical protein LUU34_00636600 [Aix galericulata]
MGKLWGALGLPHGMLNGSYWDRAGGALGGTGDSGALGGTGGDWEGGSGGSERHWEGLGRHWEHWDRGPGKGRAVTGSTGTGHWEHWAALWAPAPAPLRCQATPARGRMRRGWDWRAVAGQKKHYNSRHAPRGAAHTTPAERGTATPGTTTPSGLCGGGDSISRRAPGPGGRAGR